MKTKHLAFSIILFFFGLQSFAQEGIDCESSFEITDEHQADYDFPESFDKLYFRFTSVNPDLFLEIQANSGQPSLEIEKIKLYELEECSNLIPYDSLFNDSLLYNAFDIRNLNVGNNYLLVLYRSTNSGLPDVNFRFTIEKFVSVPCPSTYASNCNQLIKNTGFGVINNPQYTPIYAFGGPSRRSAVCEWERAFETPELLGSNTQNRIVKMWARHPTYGEGLIQDVAISPGNYYITFDLSKIPGKPKPDFFKVDLIKNAAYATTNGSKDFADYQQIITGIQNVVSMTSNDIPNAGSNSTVTFCFSANDNYDKIVFYPENSITASVNHPIEFDNVQLWKMEANAGPNVDLASCVLAVQIGSDDCILPGATYTWSPSNGLDDPNSPNPMASIAQTYTLTVNYPTTACSSYAVTSTVDVIAPTTYVIPDGSDADDILAMIPYTTYLNNQHNQPHLQHIIDDKTIIIDGEVTLDKHFVFTACKFYMKEGAKIIVDNSKLNFSHNHLKPNVSSFIKSCDDDKFWDGIYGSGDDCEIYIFGSELNRLSFSNSYNGITCNSIESSDIRFVDFLNNGRAYTINGGSPVVMPQQQYFSFKENTSKCDKPIEDNLGNLYFPEYAIYINSVDELRTATNPLYSIGIGGPTASPYNTGKTTFYGSGGGIYVENSTQVRINNVHFIDFNPGPFNFPNAGPITDKAIHINQQTNATDYYPLEVLDCNFLNCFRGIDFYGTCPVEIENNWINKDDDGSVYPYLASSRFLFMNDNLNRTYSSPIWINNNEIYNVSTGIMLKEVDYTTISNNIMDLETQQFASTYGSKNNTESVGIYVDNSNLNYIPTHLIEINNNTIKHSKVGIYNSFVIAQVENNLIEDINDVTTTSCFPFPPPCPAIPGYGIRVVNPVQGYVVKNNQVLVDYNKYIGSNPQSNVDVIGISIDNGTPGWNLYTNSQLHCNEVGGMGVGVKYSGNNIGSEFLNNKMNTNYYGFVLHMNGKLGDIGSDGIASENKWTGNFGFSRTYSSISDGSLTTLFVENLPFYDPYISNLHATTNYLEIDKDNSGNSANTNRPCSTPLLTRKPDIKGQHAYLNNKAGNANAWGNIRKGKKQQRHVIAADSVVRLEQQLLYFKLSKDSALYKSPTWKHFTDSMDNTSTGRALGKNRLANVVSQNNIDQNMLAITPILQKQQNGQNLSTADFRILENIARLCPYYDGLAVYQARSILEVNGYPLISNSCESIVASKKKVKKKKEIENTDKGYAVYPNPNQGQLKIDFKVVDGEQVLFEVYDLLGKKVFQKRLESGENHTLNLIDLQQGVYLYRLIDATATNRSGKLVIE